LRNADGGTNQSRDAAAWPRAIGAIIMLHQRSIQLPSQQP
jgi:hypothetical protein